MTISIYKYELTPDNQTVHMPIGAKVLSAGVQGNSIMIWAQVDTEAPLEERRFQVVGTGHEVENESYLHFINTVFVHDFVFHIFEEIQISLEKIQITRLRSHCSDSITDIEYVKRVSSLCNEYLLHRKIDEAFKQTLRTLNTRIKGNNIPLELQFSNTVSELMVVPNGNLNESHLTQLERIFEES